MDYAGNLWLSNGKINFSCSLHYVVIIVNLFNERLEVVELRKRGLLRGFHLSVLIFAPKLVQFFTFLALVLIGGEPMSADKVFFTLVCLHHVIQTTVFVSPLAVAGIGEILVTIRRVQVGRRFF